LSAIEPEQKRDLRVEIVLDRPLESVIQKARLLGCIEVAEVDRVVTCLRTNIYGYADLRTIF
jgi:hypothetical protein